MTVSSWGYLIGVAPCPRLPQSDCPLCLELDQTVERRGSILWRDARSGGRVLSPRCAIQQVGPQMVVRSRMPRLQTPPALRTETVAWSARRPELDAAWRRLEARAGRVPVSFSLACRRMSLPGAPLGRLVLVWDDQPAAPELVGLWALVREPGPVRVWSRLGGVLQAYDGLTVSAEVPASSVVQAAFEAVSQWPDVDAIRLGALLGDDPLLTVPAVLMRGRRSGATLLLHLHREPRRTARIQAQSKGQRKSARRRARRLAERGEVTVKELAPGAERASVVRWALDQKLAWLDAQQAPSPELRQESTARLLFAEALAADSPLRVFALYCGSLCVAAEVGLADGRAHRSWLGAYDPDYSELGVGLHLTLTVADACGAQGLTHYDLLPPSTAFKERWADAAVPVFESVIPTSRRGRLALGVLRDARSWLKSRYHALPEKHRAQVFSALQVLQRLRDGVPRGSQAG